jgi:hypothetical protein
MAAEYDYAAILTDCQMPDTDGVEEARRRSEYVAETATFD